MKKFLTVLLALLLLCGSCLAEGLNYASMTDAQLHDIVDAARNELTKRELVAAEKTVLFAQDGVTVYMTGDYTIRESSISDDIWLKINIVVVNDSGRDVGIDTVNPSVNGWDVSASILSTTTKGKKSKQELTLNVKDAEVKSLDEIEELEIAFRMFDGETYKTFAEMPAITLHFNVQ